MDGFLEHQLICRACLRIVENKTQSFGYIEDVNGNLKDMIMCCVPEMDIYVSSHPIMCFPCIQLLITVYNFKTRCLNTETIIRSYIQRNNLIDYNHVNLSCVVQELIRLNSYFRDMQNRSRQESEQSNSGNPSGPPRNPCIAPGSQHGMPGNPGGIPGYHGGVPGNTNGIPGQPNSMPGHPSSMPQNPNNMPQNPISMPQNPNSMPQNPNSMPQNPNSMSQNPNNMPQNPHSLPQNPNSLPPNPKGMLGNPNSIPGSIRPINHSATSEIPRVIPPTLIRFPENHYGPPIMHMGMPGPHRAVLGSQIGLLGNPRELLVNHCGIPRIPSNQMEERNEYLPLTREEIDAAPPVSENSDSTEETTYEVQPEELNGPIIENGEEAAPRPERRMRLVIKIDKGKVSLPYGGGEDLNEKESEQEDVEMTEKEVAPPETGSLMNPPLPENGPLMHPPLPENGPLMHPPLPENGPLMHPPQPENGPLMHQPLPDKGSMMHPPPQNNKQELYECANCTFVTTHYNFLLAHNTVCIGDHEKIDLKKCPHCPHVTNRQYALNKHINTMHTKAIWYSCDLCNYRSTDSSCLRRHKRNVHPEITGQEQLCCHLCAYRCTTEYHLKKHLLKHEENTILQCQFCSYSTKDRSNFRKHIFIHNPKAQDCEFCDYKCVSPYQMKVHLRKYHHGVGMEDIDCRSEVSISEVVDDITAAINETQTYIGHQAE